MIDENKVMVVELQIDFIETEYKIAHNITAMIVEILEIDGIHIPICGSQVEVN